MQCPTCQHENHATTQSCSVCGTQLHGESQSGHRVWIDPQSSSLSVASTGPERESQQLTMMFCDLVGSTDLSGRLDPEDLRDVVRAYQQASDTVITRYNGYMAQYQGDGLLVYFGYPQKRSDDAQRAVYAALGIVVILDDLNARLEQTHGVRLALRIGIHTGPVVVGMFGDDTRQELLAMGEASVVAAGIQSLAEPDSVVLSETTAHLLQDAFECEPLGAFSIKGTDTPVTILRALASRLTSQVQFDIVSTDVGAGAEAAERRQLTVMFCDVTDIARLATQLSPEHLLAVIKAYQDICDEIVSRYDGHIAQYLDNGVLVYFGFPHAHEDDAQRCVRTGLDIVAAMETLNVELKSTYGIEVATRIGIHTGQAVAGTMGG